MYGRNNVLINHVLLDRVLQIKQNDFLHDDPLEIWEGDLIEQIKLTRLGEMAESLSKEEIIVLILTFVRNYPELVFQILAEEYLLNKERTKENEK